MPLMSYKTLTSSIICGGDTMRDGGIRRDKKDTYITVPNSNGSKKYHWNVFFFLKIFKLI